VGDTSERLGAGEIAIVCWAVGGVVLLLVQALNRLTPHAMVALENGLTPFQWAVTIFWTLVNAYAEGYRGFQKAFSPRVIARSVHLARNPRPLFVLLAPLYAMALFHARRKRIIVAWVLVVVIVGLVMTVRHLPQPWRGIIDVGVVAGLLWGTLSIAWFFGAAVFAGTVPPDESQPHESQPEESLPLKP
jgi:hypothetical protein